MKQLLRDIRLFGLVTACRIRRLERRYAPIQQFMIDNNIVKIELDRWQASVYFEDDDPDDEFGPMGYTEFVKDSQVKKGLAKLFGFNPIKGLTQKTKDDRVTS